MDIMYGPDLPTRKGTRRRTYLFAILDDATRLIAHAQFYFEQHLITLKDALNRLLFTFVEGEYHIQPHRGIEGETPLDRWVRKSGGIRPIPSDVDLDLLFLDEVTRRVRKDGTIVLDGKAFEPGPHFIGQKVTVRYDPFDLRRIQVFSDRDERIDAFPVDLAGNRRARRLPDTESTPTSPTLRSLEHQAQTFQKEASHE